MRRALWFVFAAVFFSAAASDTVAQRATRVNFRRGAHSAVVTGTLNGYKGSRVVLIRVRAGQTMKIEAIGKHYISTFLEGPPGSDYQQDMAADCHSRADVGSTDAGDYKLSVQECQKADPWRGTFRVRITVR